jgi:hypothetical protein
MRLTLVALSALVAFAVGAAILLLVRGGDSGGAARARFEELTKLNETVAYHIMYRDCSTGLTSVEACDQLQEYRDEQGRFRENRLSAAQESTHRPTVTNPASTASRDILRKRVSTLTRT